MITEVKDGAALGFFVDKKTGQFGHTGADEGFQAQLVCFPNGKGLAVMDNSDSGFRAAPPLVAAIAKEYGWQFEAPQPSFDNAVYTLAMKEVAAAAITAARAAIKQRLPLQRGPNIALNAALGLLNAARRDDAVAPLDYQLEMTPQNDGVFEARAHIYKEMGRRDEAVRAIRRALELNPNNDRARSFLKELESARQ
jgi:tetratricopeptide (TPR) repeat protein